MAIFSAVVLFMCLAPLLESKCYFFHPVSTKLHCVFHHYHACFSLSGGLHANGQIWPWWRSPSVPGIHYVLGVIVIYSNLRCYTRQALWKKKVLSELAKCCTKENDIFQITGINIFESPRVIINLEKNLPVCYSKYDVISIDKLWHLLVAVWKCFLNHGLSKCVQWR